MLKQLLLLGAILNYNVNQVAPLYVYNHTISSESIMYVDQNIEHYMNLENIMSLDIKDKALFFQGGLRIGSSTDYEYNLIWRLGYTALYSSNYHNPDDYLLHTCLYTFVGAREKNTNGSYIAIYYDIESLSMDVMNNITNVPFWSWANMNHLEFTISFNPWDQIYTFQGVGDDISILNTSNKYEYYNNVSIFTEMDYTNVKRISSVPNVFTEQWGSIRSPFGYSYNDHTDYVLFQYDEYLPRSEDYKDIYLEQGYDNGYSSGYDDGFVQKGIFGWLTSIFGAMGGLLSLELLPSVSIGGIILVFIAIPLTYAIIKMMKGGGD